MAISWMRKTGGLENLDGLSDRSLAILRRIVESYLETGEPVGSRNLSRDLPMTLSPASVRNVMSDLEQLGLIAAPHTSAGRQPTELGLRLFVDGLLEVGNLSTEERQQIQRQMGAGPDSSVEQVLDEATEMISGLSHCAGLVLADKQNLRLKHIEFVSLEPGKALVILVSEDQSVENRIVEIPAGLPPSALAEAANFLNNFIRGATLSDAKVRVEQELTARKAELDELTQKVIQAGLAEWSGTQGDDRRNLIVRGQANLLNDVKGLEDIERIRQLFDDLESKQDVVNILGLAENAEGVKIFIGSENNLFSLSGSSLVVAPFQDGDQKIVGMLGVIGPTRLNYARIIPMVDYTAKLVSRIIS
ncbi:MAG: heat-inducible transcriptional repressor HrcA [Pseudomonadota bacterium]